MFKDPVYLGGAYFAVAFLFSWVYYFTWIKNTDAFIVHQEMNLRPLTRWRELLIRRGVKAKAIPPATAVSEKSHEEISREYSTLSGEESRLQAELQLLTSKLKHASAEVTRLGSLHNGELAANLKTILDRQTEQHQSSLQAILSDMNDRLARDPNAIQDASAAADHAIKNLAAAQNFSISSFLSEATQTKYLADLNSALASDAALTTRRIEVTDQLDTVRNAERGLLESWERDRLNRLSYFDFLYFSMGVATANTFGDLIPNDRVVRFVIVIQLILCLTLVGLFVNSVSSPPAAVGVSGTR